MYRSLSPSRLPRSEEHTSELQSRRDLVCRLLLEKKKLLSLIKESGIAVHALSHITGGGLLENVPRVLPETLAARIDVKSWQRPALFDWLQQEGNVADLEMYRVLIFFFY